MPTPAQPAQSYASHRQNRPIYLALYAIFFADFIWMTYRAVQAPSTDTILGVVTAAALLVLTFYARAFALTVQDRVIRLEMRLRLRELLPAALRSRIHEFTKGQLVAMRFASDAELPSLAEKVLQDRIEDRSTIKKMIATWEADHLRA